MTAADSHFWLLQLWNSASKDYTMETNATGLKFFAWFLNLITLFGLYRILINTIAFLGSIWRRCFRPCIQPNMYKRYGKIVEGKKISWSVVTGGSDGIGLAMCKNLAQQGFNICIVGRNLAKINEKLQLIKDLNKDIETMSIIADLS